MQLKIITKLYELHAIRDGWQDLLQRSSNKAAYLCYEWCLSSYETFHANDQLYVLILIDDSAQLLGIAPLVITSGVYRGLKVRKIGFVKNDQNPANEFILSEGLENVCLKLILDHLVEFSNWELIDLQKIQVDSLTYSGLQKLLLENGYAFGTKDNIQSPYIPVDREWDDFWNAKSQRFRKTMRNKINRVMKHGSLVIEKVPVTKANIPELETILKISANSWKHEIGNDLLIREDNWKFYNKICDLLGPKGLVSIWLLKFRNVPVAFEFHIEYNNVVYPIRADYDKNYKDISPGSILEYHIIKGIFIDKRVAEYNSCGHTYDYLMNWTDTTRKHQNFEIFSKSIKMGILYNLEYKVLVMLRKNKLYKMFAKMKAR